MSDVKRATYKSSGPDSGDYVRAERYDEIRALLVKACVEIAEHLFQNTNMLTVDVIEHVKERYTIQLRATADAFEEDTTK